eukprot:CAMPEP_0172520028 /NCGR_PEP_ID=MMETSP1066-20121228/291761_1 /TAXON_ID=671091 /ORGANISM="Coscinodiscus wailesii, Strain CCMP2513" /LENGTH=594 /DNA_ID=CAMNT_0013302711 /DNA_START=91 /DNA_END=1875 /DNA_ORIENTATION=-
MTDSATEELAADDEINAASIVLITVGVMPTEADFPAEYAASKLNAAPNMMDNTAAKRDHRTTATANSDISKIPMEVRPPPYPPDGADHQHVTHDTPMEAMQINLPLEDTPMEAETHLMAVPAAAKTPTEAETHLMAVPAAAKTPTEAETHLMAVPAAATMPMEADANVIYATAAKTPTEDETHVMFATTNMLKMKATADTVKMKAAAADVVMDAAADTANMKAAAADVVMDAATANDVMMYSATTADDVEQPAAATADTLTATPNCPPLCPTTKSTMGTYPPLYQGMETPMEACPPPYLPDFDYTFTTADVVIMTAAANNGMIYTTPDCLPLSQTTKLPMEAHPPLYQAMETPTEATANVMDAATAKVLTEADKANVSDAGDVEQPAAAMATNAILGDEVIATPASAGDVKRHAADDVLTNENDNILLTAAISYFAKYDFGTDFAFAAYQPPKPPYFLACVYNNRDHDAEDDDYNDCNHTDDHNHDDDDDDCNHDDDHSHDDDDDDNDDHMTANDDDDTNQDDDDHDDDADKDHIDDSLVLYSCHLKAVCWLLFDLVLRVPHIAPFPQVPPEPPHFSQPLHNGVPMSLPIDFPC